VEVPLHCATKDKVELICHRYVNVKHADRIKGINEKALKECRPTPRLMNV